MSILTMLTKNTRGDDKSYFVNLYLFVVYSTSTRKKKKYLHVNSFQTRDLFAQICIGYCMFLRGVKILISSDNKGNKLPFQNQ